MVQKYKRKSFFINKKFQFKLMAWMMTIALGPIVVFYSAHQFFFWELSRLGAEIKLPVEHVYFKFLEIQGQKLFMLYILCSCVIAILVFTLGLVISHRIAGPIHRLKEYMLKLEEGEQLEELSFRKEDFFSELPEYINRYVKKVNGSKQ